MGTSKPAGLFLVLPLLTVLAACTHQAIVTPTAPDTVYSAYDDKIVATFAIYVSPQKMSASPSFTDNGCGMHGVEMDARDAFKDTMLYSAKSVVTEVTPVSTRLKASQLAAKGFDGIIVVEVDSYDVDMRVQSRWFTADVLAEADMKIAYYVDTQDGRKVGGTLESSGDGKENMGSFCSGASNAASSAVREAMADLGGRLAEKISNSERLRAAF